jgi:hypothetical protein
MADDPQQNIPAPSADGGMPDVPINPQLAERVMSMYQNIDKVLTEMRVPRYERQEVEKNLMEAVAADLLTRLGARMSDEEKEALAEMTSSIDQKNLNPMNPDLQRVAGFFRGKFTQEELVTELAEATESVLKDFIEEMSKGKS